MPKPKHRKGRYSPQQRQKAVATSRTPVSPQTRATAAIQPGAVRAKATATSGSTPLAAPISPIGISRELKTIAVLGGLMLIALVVIAIVVS